MSKPSPHDWVQTGSSDCFPLGSAIPPLFCRAAGPSGPAEHRGDPPSGAPELTALRLLYRQSWSLPRFGVCTVTAALGSSTDGHRGWLEHD